MRLIFILLMLAALTGCGSVGTVGYPTGDGTYIVMRTLTEQSPFSATNQRNFMERCKTKTADSYTDCELLMVPDNRYAASPGYIAGPFQSVVPSVAGAYAGYAIGSGLSKSGSVTNNNTSSGAGASAQNSNSNTNLNRNNNLNESFNGKGYQW